MRKLLLMFVAILILSPAAVVLAQDTEAVSIDPNTIIQIIQLVLPVILPAVVGGLRQLLGGLSGQTAFWVNFVLNILGQILAALGGGDPMLAGGLAMTGGAAGSKFVDIRDVGINPVHYERRKK